MEPARDTRSVPELISDLIGDVADMFRKEGELVRAEIAQSVNRVSTGGEMMLAGAVAVLVGFIVAAQALVVALAGLVGAGWAATIVAAALLAIGAALIARGRKDIGDASAVPQRALAQMRQDTNLVRERVQ